MSEQSKEQEYQGNNVAAMMAKANATDDPDEAARLMEEATQEGARQYFRLQLFMVLFVGFLLFMIVVSFISG